MGETSASTVHNASNNVLPQPTPSLVAEDDDEPPSSGPATYRAPEMKTKATIASSMLSEFDSAVPEKDCATPVSESSENIPEKIHQRAARTDPEKGGEMDATVCARKAQATKRHDRATRLRRIFHIKENVAPPPTYRASFHAAFRYSPLNILLLCIPVSWALHHAHQTPTLIFVFSALGIIPLAALLGLGTEQIALKTSQSVGGLLNASLGNLIELIISGIALKKVGLFLLF
jgi:Ca2+:H+ antiporter